MTDKSGTAAPYDKLLERLDEGANYRGYSEGFGGSWTGLCAKAAQAIRNLTRASLQPATPTADEDLERECFDMHWKWFTERRGAADMRANAIEGLSADDFKEMLDEHESNLLDALAKPSATGGDAVAGDAKEMLELANSIEEGHARVVHLDANTEWAPYKTDVVIAALRRAARSPDVAGDVQAARAREPKDVRLALADEINEAAENDIDSEFLVTIVDAILKKFDVSRRGDVAQGSLKPAEVQRIAADAIRTFCRSLGAGAIATSQGVERIYYAGISLDALATAVALAMTSTQSKSDPPTVPVFTITTTGD